MALALAALLSAALTTSAALAASQGLAGRIAFTPSDTTIKTVEGDGTDTLQVQVRDDGRGGATLVGGTGLRGLQDRVEALGGRLTVESHAAGTSISGSLPVTR